MSRSIDATTITPAAPARIIANARIVAEGAKWQEKARRDFRTFRRLLNPDMLTNWWTDEVSGHLQQFYKDLIEGKRPKLALMAPPQHGKSKAVSDFVAWLAGVNPDIKSQPTARSRPQLPRRGKQSGRTRISARQRAI
jgi:hypothetical protein